jgi:hypothetical protein
VVDVLEPAAAEDALVVIDRALRFAHFGMRYTRFVRLVRSYVLWWIGLFWLWLAYQGEWNRIEWVAAACAATVGAALATALVGLRLLRLRVPRRPIVDSGSVPVQILVDFGIVIAALGRRLRGGPSTGVFVVRTLPSAGSGAVAAGDRAWRALLATYSPNAYVVDIDASSHTVLLHDLVEHRSSERPA